MKKRASENEKASVGKKALGVTTAEKGKALLRKSLISVKKRDLVKKKASSAKKLRRP
jgi:hypothetical protein